MLRKQKTITLGKAIEDFLNENNINKKICEYHLKRDWEKLVGKHIAQYSSNIYLKEQILFVKISSPSAKGELLMIKNLLIIKINQLYLNNLINQIVVY